MPLKVFRSRKSLIARGSCQIPKSVSEQHAQPGLQHQSNAFRIIQGYPHKTQIPDRQQLLSDSLTGFIEGAVEAQAQKASIK